MNNQPKLIILNGAAASGKTTLAKKYLNENPLAINIEGDEILTMMGQWLKYETKARELVYKLTKSMIDTHLLSRYDVLVPYLPATSDHIENFEKIANKHNAKFIEILLFINKEEATRRILDRGEWGEKGSSPVTKKDIPYIEKLYTDMEDALADRQNIIKVNSIINNIEETYDNFLKAIDI